MSRLAVRLLLVVIFHLAIGGAVYQVWRIELRIDRDRAARASWGAQASRIALSLANVRAAQQAYVAVGQTPAFWLAQVSDRTSAIVDALAQLQAAVTSEAARNALSDAAAGMADFESIDRRAREQVAMNQPLTASDLIFSDGMEVLQRVSASTTLAAAAQDAAFAADLATARRDELVIVAAALATTLFVTWVLVPAARPRKQDTANERARDGGDTAAIDARGSPPSAAPPAPGQPAPAGRVDFGALAQLCTDLGRVGDASDLPGMLGRVARLLDANGIVLWIADPAGHELLPSVAHGYTAQTLSRIGAVPRDSDNATAASYRAGSVQVVASEPGQHGAVIAPLLTTVGCIGVMAVEVRGQGEKDEDVKAASGLVAAQLATLIAAVPGVAESPAADPGPAEAGLNRS